MPALFFSLALLGLAAVDLTGIAAMPVLLLQKNPYRRCLIFLGGSFFSLMVTGLLFARGFGADVLRFESAHSWLVPGAEAVAGLMLVGIALVMVWQLRAGKLSTEPSKGIVKRLQLGNWQLFAFGMLLVMLQSVVDVVFVVAMIHIGQLQLSGLLLVAAVATYAVAALVLQLAVVLAYKISPPARREMTLRSVHTLLTKYANQVVVSVSLLLGCVLLIIAA
jgi:hypothetical protein